MADTKREIERKFEFPPADGEDRTELPDLTGVSGIARVAAQGVTELDAVYYDTQDLRLDAAQLTLRRRTGGDDAGWHLKVPVAAGVRDEIRAPLSDDVPPALAALLRSRVREGQLVPVVRLLSSREVSLLLADDAMPLAELSIDTVVAQGLSDGATSTTWTEIEVELAEGVHDQDLLDAVENALRTAGILPSASASKVARALRETTPAPPRAPDTTTEPADGTAGAHVLAHLRAERDALIALDPAVRRELPDAVHRMRVATRRLRSAFRSYAKVIDRSATEPVRAELTWLAAELGVERDGEVLAERLRTRIAALPDTLLLGPVHARLRIRTVAGRAEARRRTLAALDGERYLALLDALDALLAAPPLRPAADRPAADVLRKAVRKDHRRLARRLDTALALEPGPERDLALHAARKAAKRARYAAQAAAPALGKPAKKLAKRLKAVQNVLGEHHDSVVARAALRTLAAQAHAAGESAFTWGLLYGHEQATAARREHELPGVRARASRPRLPKGTAAP
ncbi:CYTH and CHAD domain-containing protein [Streptomyces hundungensis]|uniref:CYTH and CHAD domain-containing protein n=1 Tax=Streptomyces hundungensis TaxID=1077946 RepID=UPI003403F0E6